MRKLMPILILALACRQQESRAEPARVEQAKGPLAVESQANAVMLPAQSVMVPGRSAATPAAEAQAMPRMIVRTADVKIIVADTAKSIEDITRATEASGGYVSGSSSSPSSAARSSRRRDACAISRR